MGSAELYDPTTGKWIPTGPLNTSRYGAASGLLPDGTALVAGGVDGSANALSSAELYDQASGKWTFAGSLHPAQGNAATGVMLANGRFLVAAGGPYDYALNSAEVYDPASGTWQQAGFLLASRWSLVLALLSDDTVLTAGEVDP
jgi:hypothetical protein